MFPPNFVLSINRVVSANEPIPLYIIVIMSVSYAI